jgi:hypothetical protein
MRVSDLCAAVPCPFFSIEIDMGLFLFEAKLEEECPVSPEGFLT